MRGKSIRYHWLFILAGFIPWLACWITGMVELEDALGMKNHAYLVATNSSLHLSMDKYSKHLTCRCELGFVG